MKLEKHGGNIYRYGRHMLDFSANLNPLGMPELSKKAIIENVDSYENYPDPFSTELRRVIGRYHGVDERRICCGNGAADLIFRIALALKPERALIAVPTFSEYEESLKVAGSRIEFHYITEENGFRIDGGLREKIKEETFDAVYICSPNNPTGVPVERDIMCGVADICSETGTRLVIDECFADFMQDEEKYSLIDRTAEYQGLIILKSFTKLFSMAGLRLGYCICSDREDADAVSGCLQAWPVSTVASKAGIAAMQTAGFREKTREYVAAERSLLLNGLAELSFRTCDSQANYVFFKSDIPLAAELEKRNIMIRSCTNYRGLDERYYRAAVRTHGENMSLLKALQEIREQL